MQRTEAVKWFWPFMLVAALAAATLIALPPFQANGVLSTAEAASGFPLQFRIQTTVVGTRATHVADRAVALEPYRIQVTAKRAAAIDGSQNASLGASRADAAHSGDQAICTPL